MNIYSPGTLIAGRYEVASRPMMGGVRFYHLRKGIDFELESADDKPLDANNPAVKAMKESARQLGDTKSTTIC